MGDKKKKERLVQIGRDAERRLQHPSLLDQLQFEREEKKKKKRKEEEDNRRDIKNMRIPSYTEVQRAKENLERERKRSDHSTKVVPVAAAPHDEKRYMSQAAQQLKRMKEEEEEGRGRGGGCGTIKKKSRKKIKKRNKKSRKKN